MKRKLSDTGAPDWMAPFRSKGTRVAINVGVMTPQQREEAMELGLPRGITNMEKFVEQGVQTSQVQAKRASKPRGDAELEAIVRKLAQLEGTAKELWPELQNKLEAAGFETSESTNGEQRHWKITYIDARDRQRSVTFRTFAEKLGENRKKPGKKKKPE